MRPGGIRGQAAHTLLKDRLSLKINVLGHIAEPIVFGDPDPSGVRGLKSHDHSKERGLAMAVSAHQSDPFPGVDLKGYIVEKHEAAIAFCQSFDTNHRLSIFF